MSRKLPQWMLKSKENNDANRHIIPNTNAYDEQDKQNPVRRLRSNYSFESHELPKPIKTTIEDLPFIDYKGKIVYLNTLIDIACACDDLQEYINNTENIVPIAFDMEWPFSFQTGSGPVSVLQLCADINICYVFQISELKKLPLALTTLLKHPRVRLHGVNIKNDFHKLKRDFADVDVQPMLNQCVDLGVWANSILKTSGRWSMERLVLHMLRLRINKDKSVRMSKWNQVPLNNAQQLYAAIDVYISQVMYLDLEKLKIETEDNKTPC